MTNDRRMSNGEYPKPRKRRAQPFALRRCHFVRHLDFGIRHFTSAPPPAPESSGSLQSRLRLRFQIRAGESNDGVTVTEVIQKILEQVAVPDRKSTRLNSSHLVIS